MPLNLRASQKIQKFNVPVSYRINDNRGNFLDSRNVYSIQDRLDTRFGISRFNSIALPGAIQSLSSFIKTDGESYTVAKVGSELYSVSETGSPVLIKSGLSQMTIHRGITGNNRHIISIEEDGLFSWDGETFSILGQKSPTGIINTIQNDGDLVLTNKYRVAVTFYASKIGFESNAQELTEVEAIAGVPDKRSILVSSIPSTAENAFIDKVNIYLKNVTADGEYFFIDQINLGQTTFIISKESTSGQTPPTRNDVPNANTTIPGSGGGKYLTVFNSKLVYAGNEQYPNEVYFSEEDQFDAFNSFDTGLVLPIPGKGPVTGLGVGLFGDTVLDPFLVIFKRKSTRVYSEIGGQPRMVVLSEEIGCVSNETISVKNGVIYFLSEEGWRAVRNGRIITDDQGDAITLGEGSIDDIFKTPGYIYEVNRAGLSRAFSVYYPTLDQYMTWVSEGTDSSFSKTYVYEFESSGFKPYEFSVPATCATLGEDGKGRDIVLLGSSNGYVLKHSITERKADISLENVALPINAFAVMPWLPSDGDFDATYSFRELILRAITSVSQLTVKTFLNYDLRNEQNGILDFSDPNDGFILDQELLDEGLLGDERATRTERLDINRVGESIAIGFYQSALDSNIGLISMQIDSNKNGNRNIPQDSEELDGGFDTETGTYYPSASESAQAAAASAAEAAASAAEAGGAVGDINYNGWSARFSEIFIADGLQETLDKILIMQYAPPGIALVASPSQSIREKGVVVGPVTLVATTTKRDQPITLVTFFKDEVLISTDSSPNPSGGISSYVSAPTFSDNTNFSSKATDGIGETTSNTVAYTFVYPYYTGAGAPGKTPSQVAALTKLVIQSTSNLNRVFTAANGNVFYFAYPASYGALSSILDENGFETIGDWTLTTSNITGLNGTPTNYRIYEFKNPVVALTTNYTFKR